MVTHREMGQSNKNIGRHVTLHNLSHYITLQFKGVKSSGHHISQCIGNTETRAPVFTRRVVISDTRVVLLVWYGMLSNTYGIILCLGFALI